MPPKFSNSQTHGLAGKFIGSIDGDNLYIDVGGDAVHSIHNPASDRNYRMRYAQDISLFSPAVSVIESFDYLLSGEISTHEAMRRLRILRRLRMYISNKNNIKDRESKK